jgi:C-terminal processing protease CtpA/Prc
LTPSGTTINERGIDPDAVVNFRSDLASQYGGPDGTVRVEDDLQLSYALERLGYQAIALSQAH